MSRLILLAPALAVAELATGLFLAEYSGWGRAEALLFLGIRPWILAIAAWAVRRAKWRGRAGVYALLLLLGGIGESLFLRAIGGDPIAEMVRGWAAGGLLALAFDLLVQGAIQAGRRIGDRAVRFLPPALMLLILLIPGALTPYDRLIFGPARMEADAPRPALALMTGLPFPWGETGPFDPASRPAAIYPALQREYDISLIDHLSDEALRGRRLLLVAQPRLLEPAELVALDQWVRSGGRLLLLVDPDLAWPTALAPGDIRRPPRVSGVEPLLASWGAALEPGLEGRRVDHLETGGRRRRLILENPGRFRMSPGDCRAGPREYLATCAPGAGRAILVADADFLFDANWRAPGPRGGERQLRLADNPLILADWLDRLAGVSRVRVERPVQWRDPDAAPAPARVVRPR